MPWSTSSDVLAFLAAAGDFLASRPIEHSPLLTETAYLQARPSTDALFGWWIETGGAVRGAVGGAFVQAPRHAPLLSLMPAEAISELPGQLPRPSGLGVDTGLVDAATAAWHRSGVELAPRHASTVLRLDDAAPGAPSAYDLAGGTHRIAGPGDRTLLVRWFDELMAAHPGDPSDLAYVVDDPLVYGGIVLWTVAGEPVAMAGRSRTVAGMTRLSAVHQPGPGREYADAAFAAACSEARRVARDVLVFSGDADESVRLRELGFGDVAGRVLLAPLL